MREFNMIDFSPLEQLKCFGGTTITVLGTVTAWVNNTNLILSTIASIIAIIVGILTVRTLISRLTILDLDTELKKLEIKKAKGKLNHDSHRHK